MPDNKTVTFDASTHKLVPIEETFDMAKAASDAGYYYAREIWREMLAAAPMLPLQSERQNPVAWQVHPFDYGIGSKGVFARTDRPDQVEVWKRKGWNVQPLYAAPTPTAQSAGQEAVATIYVYETKDIDPVIDECNLPPGRHELYAAPVNGGERELGQVIDERDQYHDAAEKLADAIAKHFGVEIGEHSNLNCPWQNALDHIAQATKRAADAQQVGGDARVAELEAMLTEVTDCLAWLNSDDDGHIMALTNRARAALTSPAKVPDAVMRALDRMSTPLHDSRLSGLTAELDAANIKTIRDYVLSGAMPAKVVGDDQHPDDAAVDRFSVAMKAKLAKKRAQGRGGWDDERVCSPDDLARMLVDHVRKGDPVDVGNFAMMLFNRPDSGAALCRAALSADGDMQLFFDRQQSGFERCYEALGITDDRERSWSALVLAITDALSADGGEDKRDAERYRIVREMESSNFDNLSIRLPEQIDAYVDAIAANQAEGE